MAADLGPMEALIASGNEAASLAWLGQKVWPLGRRVNAEQLVEQVTGQQLSPQPFLTYLQDKLTRLAG